MTSTTASGTRTRMPDSGCGAIVRARVEALRSCPCGQALDADQTTHCPRCGVVVRCRAAISPGALLAVA